MTVHRLSLQSEPGAAGPPIAVARDIDGSGLIVTSCDGINALERYAAEIDRFNLAAARPNPFMSAAFLRCYVMHCEYQYSGQEERLYLFHEGRRLVGCAPMRRTLDRFGPERIPLGLQAQRFQLLAPLDTEQPGILSEPGDEERVARALVRHLVEQEKGWGLLDLMGQRPGSVLHRVTHEMTDPQFRVRDIAVEPYNEIALVWPDLPAYVRSLAKKMRSNLARQTRRLFAAGTVQLVLAEGPAAVAPWFDAYCELDARSWKRGTAASISRDPRRIRYYREILAARGGLEPGFVGILLDGVLVAGQITGGNAAAAPGRHGTWLLETAYDQHYSNLGPGNLVLLLAVSEAIRRGDRHLNFMQNFAYYKHRWGADPVDVVSVQVIRRRSLHNARALLGDARRRLLAPKYAAMRAAGTTEESEIRDADPVASIAQVDLRQAQACAAAALHSAGPGVRLLERAQAELHLPFSLP